MSKIIALETSEASQGKPSGKPESAQAEPGWQPPQAPAEPDDDDIWSDPEAVLFQEQPRTAIYWNRFSALVIRQQAPYPDDDPCVFILRNNVRKLIDRLIELEREGQ